MNILLTGGTGYIGSHAAVAIAQQGHQVVLFDNLSNSCITVVDCIAKIISQHLSFIYGDINDTVLLQQTLRNYHIDAVIHFAGLKAVGESVERPIDYYANNVQGTISLLQAMRAELVKTLVFSSSATVYGQPQYLPLDEAHPTGAVEPYGRSKLHIEEMLRDLVHSDPDWRIICLRYFNPVGAHQSGLIGENPCGVPNNLMPFIAQVAIGRRQELSVYGNDYSTPDGTGVRDYIHVIDLVEGHVAALHYLVSNLGWHVVNLGTGQGYSVLEVVKSFEDASGRSIPFRINSRRPGDIAVCYADPSKAYRLLAWETKHTLHDMCRSTWQFQQALNKIDI